MDLAEVIKTGSILHSHKIKHICEPMRVHYTKKKTIKNIEHFLYWRFAHQTKTSPSQAMHIIHALRHTHQITYNMFSAAKCHQ